jgi:hypothetical protein
MTSLVTNYIKTIQLLSGALEKMLHTLSQLHFPAIFVIAPPKDAENFISRLIFAFIHIFLILWGRFFSPLYVLAEYLMTFHIFFRLRVSFFALLDQLKRVDFDCGGFVVVALASARNYKTFHLVGAFHASGEALRGVKIFTLLRASIFTPPKMGIGCPRGFHNYQNSFFSLDCLINTFHNVLFSTLSVE